MMLVVAYHDAKKSPSRPPPKGGDVMQAGRGFQRILWTIMNNLVLALQTLTSRGHPAVMENSIHFRWPDTNAPFF